MKKQTFLLAISIMLSANLFSQKLSVFIGGGYSDIKKKIESANAVSGLSNQLLPVFSYSAGINVNYEILKTDIIIKTSPEFIKYGCKNEPNSSNMESYNQIYYGIHVPIQLGYNILNFWRIYAGPSLLIRLNTPEESTFIEHKDFGNNISVGTQFDIIKKLQISVDYTWGTDPMGNFKYNKGLKFYNRFANMKVGYIF
jgi:hypothetical protein